MKAQLIIKHFEATKSGDIAVICEQTLYFDTLPEARLYAHNNGLIKHESNKDRHIMYANKTTWVDKLSGNGFRIK